MTKPDSPRAAAIALQNYVLACGLLAAAALAMLPPGMSHSLRQLWHTSLQPGLNVCGAARAWTGQNLAWLTQWRQHAATAVQQTEELAQLRQQRNELQARVALLASRLEAMQTAAPATPALVQEELVPTRILGLPPQTLLEQYGLLDIQTDDRVVAGDYVVETAERVLDVGSRVGVSPGMLVAAGMQVRGKLLEVGERTSTFLPVRSPNYRDVVSLGTYRDGELRLIARGVLEGSGGPRCQIKLVDLNAPVAAGDWVFTAVEESPDEQALWYGNVVAVRDVPGQPHWEIWMQPAASNQFCPLAVVRRVVSPNVDHDDRLAN